MEKRNIVLRYAFALVLIIGGILSEIFGIGQGFFAGFPSLGIWLVWAGFLMLMVVTLNLIVGKKRVIDERMEYVAAKASRLTFLAFVIIAFALMIADGVSPIGTPVHMLMAYLVGAMMLVYYAAYYLMLARN